MPALVQIPAEAGSSLLQVTQANWFNSAADRHDQSVASGATLHRLYPAGANQHQGAARAAAVACSTCLFVLLSTGDTHTWSAT
jgi:hypothetical protein